MDQHKPIERENLKKDVLKEIAKSHSLVACPRCGNALSEDKCSAGAEIPYIRYSDSNTHNRTRQSCKRCKTVWVLEFYNWDGGHEGSGHILTLHAYSNCFCRRPLLPHLGIGDFGVDIERNHGQARLHISSHP